MQQNFTLSINTPCSEKFENFQKTDAGGFCQSCQKEVIDFTKMTDKEILQFFKSSKEKTCGRFHDFQLTTYAETLNPQKQNLWKAFGMGLMSFSVFSLFSIQNSYAKKHTTVISNPISEKEENQEWDNISKITSDSITLEGTVVDEKGEHLIGISVILKGSKVIESANIHRYTGTLTDVNGYYKLPNLNIGDTIIFSSIGFQTTEIEITKREYKNFQIVLKDSFCTFTGEVSVNQTYQSKHSFWQRLASYLQL